MVSALLLALALLLVLLNAFFVLAEFAIVKVRATRIEELERQGSVTARWARIVIHKLDAHLSATQLGITIASLGLGWIGEPALARLIEGPLQSAGSLSPVLAHTVAMTFGFLGITFLHFVFGELAPKSVAIRRSEASALFAAGPLRLFYFMFFPAIWFFNGSANLALRLAGQGPAATESLAHTEEELRMILARSSEEGNLGAVRSDLLTNLLDFSRLTARQMLVPRADVLYLSLDAPASENLRIVRESGHTRFPLCRGDLDRVIGIVHIKDFLEQMSSGEPVDLRDVMREALFVPEIMPADRLLRTFQRRRSHLAIVVDEYGGASGIVTLEDVLEEIVGEVQDEFDEELPELVRTAAGIYRVSGSARMVEVFARLGFSLENPPDVDTIGGYFQAALGRIARPGDRVTLGDYELKVLDARGARVRLVEARRRAPGAQVVKRPGARGAPDAPDASGTGGTGEPAEG